MCWFALVRKIWGFLANSHTQINANENLENKPYFRLCLLSNLANLLRPVYSRSKFLGIFDPFSPSLDGIPLGELDDCWVKRSVFKFDIFKTLSEAGRLITSDTGDTFLTVLSCTCSTDCDELIVFLLFSGATLGSWLVFLLGSSSTYGLNQVSLRSIFFAAPLCELCSTRYTKFGVIVTYLKNGTVENSSSNTTWNWGETWQVSGFRTRGTDPAWNGELLIYIPAREWVSHWGIPDPFPCNLSFKT